MESASLLLVIGLAVTIAIVIAHSLNAAGSR